MSIYSSGVALQVGDRVNGYEILKVFDPGQFTYPAKAKAANGRNVFFKKYRKPGGSSPWQAKFVSYQHKLKDRIQGSPARQFCYEFIEFFKLEKASARLPMSVFYQVFEWIDGGSDLRGMLGGTSGIGGGLSWDRRVIFSKVMLGGINAIHKAGVVHTDLKPENLYLIPDSTVAVGYKLRIIDMDFSLIVGETPPWAGIEGNVGTPLYMSPEHLRSEPVVSASDVFTCALILCELIGHGHPAESDPDAYDRLTVAGGLRRFSLQQDIAGVADSEFLVHVINGALRPEASKRPSAEQLLKALNGRLEEWDGRKPSGSIATPVDTILPKPVVREGDRPSPQPPPTRQPDPERSSSKALLLSSSTGQRVRYALGTTVGREAFKNWGPDFEQFMSKEQFKITRAADGQWLVEHIATARNSTNLDGRALTKPEILKSGSTLSLGKTGKCPIMVSLVA